MTTYLLCGDRNWDDYSAALTVATCIAIEPNAAVIHGNARGADRLAGAACAQLGIPVRAYPAQWELYGRRAGPIRNQQMLIDGKPDIVIYFHDNLEASKGTADMVRRARRAGLQVYSWQEYVHLVSDVLAEMERFDVS